MFGQLALGSRPSFVMLDQDPRENVGVLLDTKAYARFATREGVIVRNELQATPLAVPEASPKPHMWKAYTPAPSTFIEIVGLNEKSPVVFQRPGFFLTIRR
ncbi:MAG: hypothetical protein KJO60_05700 [Desulfofustis sp.]|nr:hypothetical protein [Desulfofustis sp.]